MFVGLVSATRSITVYRWAKPPPDVHLFAILSEPLIGLWAAIQSRARVMLDNPAPNPGGAVPFTLATDLPPRPKHGRLTPVNYSQAGDDRCDDYASDNWPCA